jgi:MYXO-CTERM domain-containing protein
MSRAAKVGRVFFLLSFTAISTPALVQTAVAQERADVNDDGFDDWGLLGLLGLAGLLGRKRDNVDHTRRP